MPLINLDNDPTWKYVCYMNQLKEQVKDNDCLLKSLELIDTQVSLMIDELRTRLDELTPLRDLE